MEIQQVNSLAQNAYLNILVYGGAGVGKTVLCATAGKPTLIISLEKGLLSLANAPAHVHAVEITTVEDMQEVYKMLAASLEAGERRYEWVAVDSITDYAELVLAQELQRNPDGRAAYPLYASRVFALIKAFQELDYHFIATAKQSTVKDEYNGLILRGPSMPGKKVAPELPYRFDEVFAMEVVDAEAADGTKKQRRALHTARDLIYDAKDRSGRLDATEHPNLSYIESKIFDRQSEPTQSKPQTENVGVKK